LYSGYKQHRSEEIIVDDGLITIILRLTHVLAGVFWAGTAFLMAGYVVPTVRATGREGGTFVQHLMEKRKLHVSLGIAMLLTVLSGLAMYLRLTLATHGAWAGTAPGIAYGLGAVAAIVGGFVGAFVNGSAGRRLAAIGASVGAGRPSPEQQAEMARLQTRIGSGTRVAAALLVVAVSAMAVGRYL
jgi:hypothetical protein